MRIFRYILILPASVAIWFLTLIVGMFCLEQAVGWFCEGGDAGGIACFDAGWSLISDLFVSGFSGISAALIILFSAFLAPERKYHTCIVVYGLGMVTALILAISMGNAWGPFFGAMIIGALSLIVMQIVLNKKMHANNVARVI